MASLKRARAAKGGIFTYETSRGRRWGIDYIDPVSNRWRRKVGFKNEIKVLEFRKKRDEERAGVVAFDPIDVTFGKAASAYVEHRVAAGRSKKSYEKLERHWKPLLKDRILRTITSDQILTALKDLAEKRKWSPQTWNTALAELSGLFTFAAAQEPPWIARHPIEHGRVPTRPKPGQKERWLSVQEIERLVDKCPDWLARIVRFACATGMRLSEVCGLLLSDCRRDRKRRVWLERRDTKSGEVLRFPATGWLAVMVEEEMSECRRPQDHLFPGPRRRAKDGARVEVRTSARKAIARELPKAIAAAGLRVGRSDREGVTFHTLRHTAASHCIQAGLSMYDVMKLLNLHSDRMVRVYAHLGDAAHRRAAGALAEAVKPRKALRRTLRDAQLRQG